MIKTTGKFECIQKENEISFKLSGEIDHHNAVAIRSDMDKILVTHRPSKLYLDLSGIDFMDSSGLGLIMGRYTLMKKFGGVTVIKNPAPRVIKILKLSAIERLIKIEEDK
jgi:stage II sporulation protein AA (anti-sigma F factor antagonist)